MFKTSTNLFSSIAIGIIAGFFALLLLQIFNSFLSYFDSRIFINSFFVNEIGEELTKLFFIYLTLNLLISDKNNWTWGVINAVLIGIGFGFFEVVLIVLSLKSNFYFSTGIILMITIHAFTSLFLGLAMTVWQHNKKLIPSVILVLIAIVIHIIYNTLASNFI